MGGGNSFSSLSPFSAAGGFGGVGIGTGGGNATQLQNYYQGMQNTAPAQQGSQLLWQEFNPLTGEIYLRRAVQVDPNYPPPAERVEVEPIAGPMDAIVENRPRKLRLNRQ